MKMFPDLYRISSQKLAIVSNMGWFEGSIWKWTLDWKRALLQPELQHLDELTVVLSQHCPQQGKEDTLLWQGQNTYSVKELQRKVNVEVEIDSLVCTVWKKLAPPKVELFMWLALLGKLNTRQRLCDIGILQEDQATCPLCVLQSESIDHILLSCHYSQQIWQSIATDLGQPLTEPESFKQHYERWLATPWRSGLCKKVWMSTFFAAAWCIWLTRNEIIFQHKAFIHEDICQNIKRKVAFWTKAWKDRVPCTE